MTPRAENRLLALLFLTCWGLVAGIVGWVIRGWWLLGK